MLGVVGGRGRDVAGGTARPPGPPARRRGVSRPDRSAAQPGRGGDPQSAGDAVVEGCHRNHGVVQMMELKGAASFPRTTAQHPAEA